MMKIIRVTTNNTIETMAAPKEWSDLKNLVGGYFQIVKPLRLIEPFRMIVDEEGLMKNSSLNWIGSWLYGMDFHKQPIVGNIVFLKEIAVDGMMDFAGLDERECAYLLNYLEMIKKIAPAGQQSKASAHVNNQPQDTTPTGKSQIPDSDLANVLKMGAAVRAACKGRADDVRIPFPCPKCGGKAEGSRSSWNGHYSASCSSCGVSYQE